MIRILAVLMALSVTSPALAAGVTATECDRFAAHPYDPNKKTPGVAFDDIEAGRALMSCATAFSEQPDVLRFKYQYGRSLLAAQRPLEAMIFLRAAAYGGYAAAEQSLATVLYDEDGLADEKMEAIELFRRAAKQGHAVAQLRVASFYLRGEGGLTDLPKAEKFVRLAADQGLAAAQIALELIAPTVLVKNTVTVD